VGAAEIQFVEVAFATEEGFPVFNPLPVVATHPMLFSAGPFVSRGPRNGAAPWAFGAIPYSNLSDLGTALRLLWAAGRGYLHEAQIE
jgi:hypothetical protein